MAKMGDDDIHQQHAYGSQFFITLANTERELNGKCTMFGRVEGDTIYNVVKIAEAELVEGTDRPVYAVKITSCEVRELGPFEGKLRKRPKKVATHEPPTAEHAENKKKKKKKGKVLLSFGEEGDEDVTMPLKPKFNTRLVTADTGDSSEIGADPVRKPEKNVSRDPKARKKSPSPPPSHISSAQRSSPSRLRQPKTPDPNTQIPLPDSERPERSPNLETSAPRQQIQSKLDRTNAEIASLKASMRRTLTTEVDIGHRKRSALEAMIPETAIRGRKRPPRGDTTGQGSGTASGGDTEALKLFKAFKAKLESADSQEPKKIMKDLDARNDHGVAKIHNTTEAPKDYDDEEAQLCDLHFIANCQSCRSWDDPEMEELRTVTDDVFTTDWMTHKLQFGKDTLGKDLSWKKKNQDADSLVVIDPREKEKELVSRQHRHGHGRRDDRDRDSDRGRDRDRERERKREMAGDREWDRRR